MPGPLRAVIAATLAAGLVFAAGCDRGHGASRREACAAPEHEAIDPRSTRHLFPGAPDPGYLTDPPTSGPHRLGPPVTGAVSSPIRKSVQVAMLESGYVIVQYRDPGAAKGLAGLAGDRVTVAPAARLPAPVVATAWTWKLQCSRPDLVALRRFIDDHRGAGSAHG